jgi:hypothetical protein
VTSLAWAAGGTWKCSPRNVPVWLGARLVVLDEAARDADVAQPLLVKGFAEPTAVVDVALGNHSRGRFTEMVETLLMGLSRYASPRHCAAGSRWYLPIDAAILNDLDVDVVMFSTAPKSARGIRVTLFWPKCPKQFSVNVIDDFYALLFDAPPPARLRFERPRDEFARRMALTSRLVLLDRTLGFSSRDQHPICGACFLR